MKTTCYFWSTLNKEKEMRHITARVASLLTGGFVSRSNDFKDGFTTALKFVDIAISKEPMVNWQLKADRLEKELEDVRYKLSQANRKLERFEGLEPERESLMVQLQSLKANNENYKATIRLSICNKIYSIVDRNLSYKKKYEAIVNLVHSWYANYKTAIDD